MMNEPMYCNVCRMAVNRLTTGTTVGYVHVHQGPEAMGHDPVPVPLSTLENPIMKCDFCSSLEPVWAYTAADQVTDAREVVSRTYSALDFRDRHEGARVRSVKTAPGLTNIWGETWAACEECAAFIEARNVLGLVGRVTDSMPKRLIPNTKKLIEKRGELIDLYETLFASLKPGRERLRG